MKTKSISLLVILITIVTYNGSTQDSISAKLTQSAIDTRISEIRMGEIIIHAEPGATVKVEQIRHEFLFGTAIPNEVAENAENALSEEDREMYLKILSENFNYAVHENALKWYDCEKEENIVDYSVADRIWELCNERNIPMRGHCVFWAKDKYIMPWLYELNNDELRAAIHSRATSVANHYKGRIEEFDLNNEMIHGDFFRRRLGYGIVNEMALMVKAENPNAKLYVNDYGVLDIGYNDDTYILQIQNLLANGVPIDGIGCQAHLAHASPTITPAEHVQRTLDKLAKFDLPIKITEALFIFDDEETRVRELKKLLPIYFAHPSVEAIVIWGFWEGSHWVPNTAMWKKDFTATPQAEAYRTLVFDRWWTQITDQADDKGILKARAFYGDYTITSGGVTKKVTLGKEDGSIEVMF
ncbi:Anti-sigma-I factor RsgI6 [subsurface metagenome]